MLRMRTAASHLAHAYWYDFAHAYCRLAARACILLSVMSRMRTASSELANAYYCLVSGACVLLSMMPRMRTTGSRLGHAYCCL